AGVQTNDAIGYWLVASNTAGSATSSVVSLTVVLPMVITQQPSNQTLAVGSMLALTTAAEGSEPFGYQWYFNNLPLTDNSRITGSATSSLSISNAQTSDTGNYTFVVTNLLTAATSSVATVKVLVPPGITTQPLGRSSPLGLTNIFAATVSGAAPLSYQWQLNGTNIPGATNTSYFIAAVGTNDLGVYQFVASNAVGMVVSSNALLTVGPVAAWGYNVNNQCVVPPGLSNVTTIAGGLAYSLASRLDGSIAAWGNVGVYTNSSFTNVIALSASANGALALRSDGSVVGSGSINPLSFKVFPSNVVAMAAGYGHGLALRAEGTVAGWGLSAPGGPYPPAIVPPGLTKVIAVAAGYQHSLALRSDGTVAAWGFSVATNVPIGLSNVVAIAAGTTHSLALKSDGTLVAWGAGPGTNIPAGLSNVMTIAAGNYFDQRTSVSFAVRSNGTVVAWGLSPYPQTNAPSGLTNVVAVVAGSYHALALVNDPALARPLILRQPAGGTAWSGRDWTLQAAAAGAAPLNYQWLFNGTNLDGATNAALLLPAIQTNNAGNYQVVVSNLLGAATSLSAPLTVMDSAPFLLTQPPTNLPVFLGARVALSAAIAGSGPLQLQWQFNSNNIPGATNDTLSFDRVHLTN
ncbi:MAG TPA: immunoglobulin domain-containing protein, partial [Verrucomicrobiae bacterium]